MLYHLRPFMALAPLHAGAEAFKEHCDNTGDEGETVHTGVHDDETSVSSFGRPLVGAFLLIAVSDAHGTKASD